MKQLMFAACCLITLKSQAADLDMANKIRAEGLYNSHVLESLYHLTDEIGPRLTGSPQMLKANHWTKQKLTEWGLENAHLETFEFGRGWSFDSASIDLLSPRKVSFYGIPLAWTPGTNGDVFGEVVVFDAVTEQELAQYRGKLQGKFLLIGDADDIDKPSTPVSERFSGESLSQLGKLDISQGASHGRNISQPSIDKAKQKHYFGLALSAFLAEEKPAGVLYRSSRQAGVINTKSKSFRPNETFPVPAMTITQEHFNFLYRQVINGKAPKLKLNIKARFHDEDHNAYNTIAEIKGSDKADEIVMLGAHLDSWHGSTGAVDNAAGVAVTMEAVRILKALDVKPKRTIRIALWAGEEQGLIGSQAYVERHFATRPKPTDAKERMLPSYLWRSVGWPITPLKGYEKLSVYFNMDNGSGRFRGIYTEGNVAVNPIFANWFSPFSDLSSGTISTQASNYTDHEAFDNVGLPGFQFIQDPLDYDSRLHHSHLDALDHVSEDDLKQASVIMAAFVYNAAMSEQMMPRKPMPKAPPAHLKHQEAQATEKARRERQKEAKKALEADNYHN